MKEQIKEQLKNLTKEEQIEELENRMFYLDMKDRWDSEDHEYYKALNELLNELK